MISIFKIQFQTLIKFTFFSVTLLIAGCSFFEDPEKERIEYEFWSFMHNVCTRSHNNDYCDCWANTLEKQTSYQRKKSIALGDPMASFDFSEILIENEEELRRCDVLKLPQTLEKNSDDSNQTVTGASIKSCPEFNDQKPLEAKTEAERFMGLSEKATVRIKSVDASISQGMLTDQYFSELKERMVRFGKILESRLPRDSERDIVQEYTNQAESAVACAKAVMASFYAEYELDNLYRLYHTSSDRNADLTSIFNARIERLEIPKDQYWTYRNAFEASLSCKYDKCVISN
ncbi:hypothetical protein ACFOEK_19630 [Litoribrevibacter euphylliae]|uniref:Lipoprotein n=1 Tax=Litoribrevibacter euphylliae TaxID=1834034 RepID=A0ABV7HM87_9GAMM